MKKIYYLGTCSTNNRILKNLNLDGIELQDIKKNPMTEVQVKEMAKIAGSYEALFSRKAMKYRSMRLNEMELSEDQYSRYIIEEYTFLKRPVAIIDDEIFIGNSKKNIEALAQKLK
jgi:arsenate reductase